MDERQQRSVTLQLAESGRDLLAAIEAAQFARLVDRSEPDGPAEAAAVDGFVDLFLAASESWDDVAAVERAGLLARLGERLDRLEGCGLFVYWCRVELAVARTDGTALQLPLTILSIGRSGAPTIEVAIPGALALDPGRGAIH
ncbi:MAG TPA: hypothetical protein VLE23_06225 [Geminicoccaceae bacterium]|nr:hypothetical protein [Geminicoccaceae bacterium]